MKMMWQRRNPLIIGRHMEEICGVIDDAIVDYKNGKSSFLALKLPFRHTKSDTASRYLPANFIGKFPDDEVIVAAYASPLARTFSRFCRSIMLDPTYQYIYPGIGLAKDQRSVDEWSIEGYHGLTSWLGIGGSITGKGANCIIIDDFFKNRAAAESEVVRNYVWESITNDILTRRAPVCIVIILATPWHVDDAFGRIEKHRKIDPDFPEFREVKLPAFSDKYPTGTLFPERYSKSWYLSQKAILGPYGFAGLMQCDPIARGGNLFEVDKIKYYEGDPPEGLMWCRGWDLASTEKERVDEDPDFTAGVKVGVRWLTLADGENIPEIYVDDVLDGRWASPMRNKIIKAAIVGDGPQTQVAVESFGQYKDAYNEVKKALKGVRKVKKLELPGDKVTKASVLEPPISAGNFYVRKNTTWTEKFIEQLKQFPGAAHDDYVDGTVVGYEGLNPYEKRVWPQLQGRHITELNINWNLTKNNPYASLHYAGLWQKEDLSVWVVLCLWDALKGFLFVYDGFMVEDAIPGAVLPRLIKRARLKDYACEGIVCSPLMWEQKGYTKNVALQYRRELNKVNISAPVREAFNFDEYGSIIEIGQLFDTNMIRVDSKAKSMLLQMMSWVTINRGKNLGSKPDTEDDGYCRALCLIVSELRLQELWTQIIKPILADYNKAELVQKIYESKKIR
jgi:predicted phage terminase large subunit-like protein